MAKDTFYFSHDYNARSDEKIRSLLYKHGMTGYGIYWSIIEELYNNANALRTDYERIAFELRCSEDQVKSVVNNFGLFVFDNGSFGSLSVEKRLMERNIKSSKARDSAVMRWSKNANAMLTQCDSNAIKERKGKEIKERKGDIEYRKLAFALSLSTLKDGVNDSEIEKFIAYWTEPNQAKTKMRFELEKTWDTGRRWNTWVSRAKNFQPKGTGSKTEQLKDAYLGAREILGLTKQ